MAASFKPEITSRLRAGAGQRKGGRGISKFFAELGRHEAGRFALWSPVYLALGIGLYFHLPEEPSAGLALQVFSGGVLLAALFALRPRTAGLAGIALLVGCGFALGKLRTELVRAPVIPGKGGIYTIEARLDALIALPGSQKQFLLGDLRLDRLAAEATPVTVRITSRFKDEAPPIGARIRLRAVLRPPPAPVRPDGFDFARKAWFSQIGGVGFALTKAEVVAAAMPAGWRVRIEQSRRAIAENIRAVASGAGAEIAVALIIGDRRALGEEVMDAVRISGLAHMLAISGMHMTLVAGTLFWFIRALLALSETLALRLDIRRIAALAGLAAAAFYYLISGMGLATLRSFIMISIVFSAVLVSRSALSMRNISVAAFATLVFLPESLLDVSFQMSFAAVAALIAVYERRPRDEAGGRRPRVLPLPLQLVMRLVSVLWGITLTTLVAGVAVLPFAVYHFHQISTYSILGNLLAVPVLSFFVMPLALIGMVLMPLGWHALPLSLMVEGTDLIIAIAGYVAKLQRARLDIGMIGLLPLLLFTAGGLWLVVWQSWLRFAGIVPLLAGLIVAPLHATPFLLVDRDGKTVVLIGDDGRFWPSDPRAGKFSLQEWRRAYAFGDEDLKAPQQTAAAVSPWHCDQYGCTALFKGRRIAFSRHPGALEEDCRLAQILIATYPVSRDRSPCSEVGVVIDIRDLKRNGAHAAFFDREAISLTHSTGTRGKRPWVHGG